MRDIEPKTVSCVEAARRCISESLKPGAPAYLSSFLEGDSPHHLAFLYENELFFLFVQTEEHARIDAPDFEQFKLASIAARATAIVLHMKYEGHWSAKNISRPYISAFTGQHVDLESFAAFESSSQIARHARRTFKPITPYELQDISTSLVISDLKKRGAEIRSTQAYRFSKPNIVFDRGDGNEYVFVRSSRYPNANPDFSQELFQRIEELRLPKEKTHFASVGLANARDAFDPSGDVPALDIARGDPILPRFKGLVSIDKIEREFWNRRKEAQNRIDPEGSTLISWKQKAPGSAEYYCGDINWEDIDPRAQDAILRSFLKMPLDKDFASAIGLRGDQQETLELIFDCARSFLVGACYIREDTRDQNTEHQIVRFFGDSVWGQRVREALQNDRAAFERTPIHFHSETMDYIQAGNLRLGMEDRDKSAIQKIADLLGLKGDLQNPFPLGENRKLGSELKLKRSVLGNWDIVRTLKDFLNVKQVSPLLSGLGYSQAEVRDIADKRLSKKFSELQTALLTALDVVNHNLETYRSENVVLSPDGLRLLDFGFDCVGSLERLEPGFPQEGRLLRQLLLLSAYNYNFDPSNWGQAILVGTDGYSRKPDSRQR